METSASARASTGTGMGEVYDRAASTYDRTGVDFFGRLGERLVAGLAPRAGGRVLDIGCGSGACTVPAALAVGSGGEVVGVDTSTAMLARASEEVARRGLTNVTLRAADATDLPFPPASFDVVLAGLVVFLLPDPLAAVQAFARPLRPSGVLAMSTFGADDPSFFEVTNAVVPYLDGPLPEVPGRAHGPLRTKEGIGGLLRAASLERYRIVEEDVDLEFATPGQWWEWLWQTGGRMVLERVPAARLPAAREAAFTRMEAVRADRGRYVIRWNVWCVYADREG